MSVRELGRGREWDGELLGQSKGKKSKFTLVKRSDARGITLLCKQSPEWV
jgi:hypothetical protein